MEPKAKFHTGIQLLWSFTGLNLQIEANELGVIGIDLSGEGRQFGKGLCKWILIVMKKCFWVL